MDIGRPPDSWVTQLSTARYGHRQSKPPPSADTTHRPTDRWTVPLYNLPATTRNVKTGSFQNQMKDLVETLPLLLSMDFKFAITILRVAIACSFSTLKMETAFFSETCVKLHQNTEGGGVQLREKPKSRSLRLLLKKYKMRLSHFSNCDYCCLLGCEAIQLGRRLATFRRYKLPPY